jgi:phosphate transport system protein
MSEHTVKAFDSELHELTRRITEMGALVVKQIGDAVSSLAHHDVELARRVIAADADVDRLQREIEENAVLTIARRQPMAVDLREIVASLRVATGLERVGDYAKNISKRVIATGAQIGPAAAVRGLQHMADLVVTALSQVLEAYAQRDVGKALAVWNGDEAIDAANKALFVELLADMMADPSTVPSGIHLLFCAKNIERIGDHATNIAETIYYIVQGVPLDAERPRGDAIGGTVSPSAAK